MRDNSILPVRNMKFFACLLMVVACVRGDTSRWTQIRAKFEFSGALQNVESFWRFGNTLAEALANGGVRATSSNEFGLATVCTSQRDVRVCSLYDPQGFIAGMQLAIPPSDVDGRSPYSFSNFPVYEKKYINGIEYWTSTYYVVNPITLASGGRTSFTRLGDGLWIKNGTVHTEVPTDEASIAANTPYTRQNCLPNMGTHYYYKTTKNTLCTDFQPFFLITTRGQMNALGWQFFGRTKYVDRNWYDDIGRQAAEFTVPNGPKCLADWAETYGVISVHMYFTEQPWNIKCNQATESAVPITGFNKVMLDTLYFMADVYANIRRTWMNLYRG